jgi:hypothetical protein
MSLTEAQYSELLYLIGLVRAQSSSSSFGPSADLFGNGSNGDITINGLAAGFLGGDYENFTLGPAGVLTPPIGQGIIIRARGSIHIQGKIDTSGAIQPVIGLPGVPSVLTIGDLQQAQAGGSGGGGGGQNNQGQQNFGGGGGGGGPNIGYINGTPSNPGSNGNGGNGPPIQTVGGNGTDATDPISGGPSGWLLSVLRLPTWRAFAGGVGGLPGAQGQQGGQGGNGPGGQGNGGNGGNGGTGGNGGGTILLVAPSLILDPAAQLLSNGAPGLAATAGNVGGDAPLGSGGGGGGAGSGGGGGQGGCGGLIYLLTQSISDPGPCVKSVLGGAGGAFGAGALGGAGDGVGQPGGASGHGANGAIGSAGILFQYIL